MLAEPNKNTLITLSQLHIYIKILLQLSNLQIVFFTNFNFSLLQEWEYQSKKIDQETITQNQEKQYLQ